MFIKLGHIYFWYLFLKLLNKFRLNLISIPMTLIALIMNIINDALIWQNRYEKMFFDIMSRVYFERY